ncbi:MAG: HAD family phosphatase [Halanaerobiales bacterium]|nr:HAD family phosphatase [Halanaerobiales bacterium]
MIKNVVFDLGNVLLDFNSDNIIADHIEDEKLHQRISKNIFESKEWIKLDKGEISASKATEIFIKRQPENEKLIKEIMHNWKFYLRPIKPNVEVLNKLANMNINLYILSNFHKEAFEVVYNKYDFFKHFDGMIISYQVKAVKPDKIIYEKLINSFDILPKNTLFIDDSFKNIQAAEKLGFKTIHFNDNISLEKEISNDIENY